MKYNFIDIGNRLTNLRKQHNLSQDKLIEILQDDYGVKIGRNTLSKIENGLQDSCNFNLDLLTSLADFYNCEVGYLLCEYNCSTGRNTDINHATGLNDKAINSIDLIRKQDNQHMELLNLLLSYGGMESLLRNFDNLIHLPRPAHTYTTPGTNISGTDLPGIEWLSIPNQDIIIDNDFLESVAFKKIEKTLQDMKQLYINKKEAPQ